MLDCRDFFCYTILMLTQIRRSTGRATSFHRVEVLWIQPRLSSAPHIQGDYQLCVKYIDLRKSYPHTPHEVQSIIQMSVENGEKLKKGNCISFDCQYQGCGDGPNSWQDYYHKETNLVIH